MPDFLTSAFAGGDHVSWETILIKQGMAFVLGAVIALIFRLTRGDIADKNRSLMTTLVLLTLLITTISSVIGDNVARAFSLVGALSIVRFRTVVEDTRDTAFVILAVGVGMALGAGYLNVPLVLIPAAGLAAWLFGPRRANGDASEYRVSVRAALAVPEGTLRATIAGNGGRESLVRAATARQGALSEYEYRVLGLGKEAAGGLLDRIRAIEGVSEVEIEQT